MMASALCVGLGIWQDQKYQLDRAFEDRYEWQVCNSTFWAFPENMFDAVVDIQTPFCRFENVSLFVCHNSNDPPRCLRDATNAYLQPAWNCVTMKLSCVEPPMTHWPDTDYQLTRTRAIILIVIGGLLFLLAAVVTGCIGCVMWVDFFHRR